MILFSFSFLDAAICRDLDSIAIYDEKAEEAFFRGDLDASIHAYQHALISYWNHRDSTNIIHINERIRLIEKLAVILRETGNCGLAVSHFKACFHHDSEKKLIARVVNKIIRCQDQPIKIDTQLRTDILTFFKLDKIDYGAHIQLQDLLSGAMPEESELINFFLILEKGFAPAIEAMTKQEEAQDKFNIVSFIAFATILIISGLGFTLYISKKKQDHIQREKVALLIGKEKETDRLSIDLHDILGYKIVELKDIVSKLNTKVKDAKIDAISSGLDELHESMRYIVQSNLTPESLKFGLAPALETLINRINKLGVIRFELYKYGLKRVDVQKEKHVFYVIQELVNNIIKHSKGKLASIEITQGKEEINIMVEDDGIGYQPSIDTLKTVKARTSYLNGTVMEDSVLDHGSTIIVTIPI